MLVGEPSLPQVFASLCVSTSCENENAFSKNVKNCIFVKRAGIGEAGVGKMPPLAEQNATDYGDKNISRVNFEHRHFAEVLEMI